MMKLKKLLKSLPITAVKGSKDIDITGICSHSKLVIPGNLFVARSGTQDDGTRYIPEAIAAGAVAIATDIYDPSLRDVTQIISPDVNKLEGDLAAEFYRYPSQELFLVGITGTNGKTTSTFLVKHILDSIGEPCGLIGTIENIIGTSRYAANLSTPDVITNQKILREMVAQGCKAAVMEVTSHALEQQRTRHLSFEIAAFTNLTQDHLDYHVTMERYAAAKAKFFDPEYHSPKVAVVNHDDPWHSKVLEKYKGEVISFGMSTEATLSAHNIKFEMGKSHFEAHFGGKSAPFQTPLVGRFNLYNCLTAIGIGLAHGLSLEQLQPLIASAPSVSGRLQPVSNARDLHIYVDYAHTPDSLKQVLTCLRELKRGKIITVFGCGGDRDRTNAPSWEALCRSFLIMPL